METERYKERNIDQQAQRQRAIKSKKLRLSENQRAIEKEESRITERNVDRVHPKPVICLLNVAKEL